MIHVDFALQTHDLSMTMLSFRTSFLLTGGLLNIGVKRNSL